MARSGAGTVLCAALAMSLAATGAFAKPRAGRPDTPPAAAAKPATAAPTPAVQAPAPHRTEPPALALRPEFSEGEWSDMGGQEQLDPTSLAGSAAPVDLDGGRLETARVGSDLAKISERQLQGAPVPTSRLDQPMTHAPTGVAPLPSGLTFTPSGFNLSRVDAAE